MAESFGLWYTTEFLAVQWRLFPLLASIVHGLYTNITWAKNVWVGDFWLETRYSNNPHDIQCCFQLMCCIMGILINNSAILYNDCHNIQCCFELMCYLMDCIPFWIHYKLHSHQIEIESRSHCLKRHGWEELNHHNTFPSWVMYLKHHHKWSRNPSWKNRVFVFLKWQLQRVGTYMQLECDSRLKDRKLISIVCPICTWISQVKSRLLS